MLSAPLFCDRTLAGEQLADVISQQLEALENQGIQVSPVVYALPRGGIPVAAPVAKRLGCPIEILVAKKITRPENPELALGAITADGFMLWNTILSRRIPRPLQDAALQQALQKAKSQSKLLEEFCPQWDAKDSIALVIDDGIATGMTIAAAAISLKERRPSQIWICAPIAPLGLNDWLQQWGDRVILLDQPQEFFSVSRFYQQFPQVETSEAQDCLRQHNHPFLPAYPASETVTQNSWQN